MLDRIARVSDAHPIRVILVALAVAAAALGIGISLIGGLSASGFNDPASNAVVAQDEIVAATGASAVPSLIAVVDPAAPIASPEGQAVMITPREPISLQRFASAMAASTPRFGICASENRRSGSAAQNSWCM